MISNLCHSDDAMMRLKSCIRGFLSCNGAFGCWHLKELLSFAFVADTHTVDFDQHVALS